MVEARSLNHWITREFPFKLKKNYFYIFNKFSHFYTVLIKETSLLLFLFMEFFFFLNPTTIFAAI